MPLSWEAQQVFFLSWGWVGSVTHMRPGLGGSCKLWGLAQHTMGLVTAGAPVPLFSTAASSSSDQLTGFTPDSSAAEITSLQFLPQKAHWKCSCCRQWHPSLFLLHLGWKSLLIQVAIRGNTPMPSLQGHGSCFTLGSFCGRSFGCTRASVFPLKQLSSISAQMG